MPPAARETPPTCNWGTRTEKKKGGQGKLPDKHRPREVASGGGEGGEGGVGGVGGLRERARAARTGGAH